MALPRHAGEELDVAWRDSSVPHMRVGIKKGCCPVSLATQSSTLVMLNPLRAIRSKQRGGQF